MTKFRASCVVPRAQTVVREDAETASEHLQDLQAGNTVCRYWCKRMRKLPQSMLSATSLVVCRG